MSTRARRKASVLLVAAALIVAACGSAAPSTPVVATPRPTPTPDPHLTEPASVDVVIGRLGAAGLVIQASTASRGADGEPVKRVAATYAGWPLALTEFSTAAKLREVGGFEAGAVPAEGDAPFALAGLNILVEFGPPLHTGDPAPDARFVDAARALAAALDPLLGPLQASVVEPVGIATAPGPTAPSPAPASPSP